MDLTLNRRKQKNRHCYELYFMASENPKDLVKKRKRYPMTDVIYFIQPDEESIEKLIEDFPKDDELPYD